MPRRRIKRCSRPWTRRVKWVWCISRSPPRRRPIANPDMTDKTPSLSARLIYTRLLRYAAPHWRMFAVAVVAMLEFAATNTGFAALVQPMSFGLFLLRGLANFASAYCMAAVGRDVIHSLRREMFAKLLQLPTPFYDKTSSGDLLSKLIFDVEQVNQAATNALANVVRDGCTIIGLLIWMAYINWMLTVVFIVFGPPIAIGIATVNRRFRRISKRIQTSMADVTGVSEEAISGHRVVKIFGGQDYETRRFEVINDANRKLNMKLIAASAGSVCLI